MDILSPEGIAAAQPLVTVITVTYNSSAYVRDAVESVVAQTYKNIEYIIADDCSTDDSWNIICEYKDPRIKAYRNEVNLREYPNRNKAISEATGKYLIFIDGDDVLYPHAISTFVYYEKNYPDLGMYISREWDPKILVPLLISSLNIYKFEYLDNGILGGNFTNVFFNTQILKSFSLPLNIKTGDTYIQLKIAQHYPALIIPGNLAWWRRRRGNATEKLFSDYKYLAETMKYRISLLDESNLLNGSEALLAKMNLYGGLLRILIKLIFKAKFREVIYIANNIKIPFQFYRSIFYKSKYNYFDNFNGDKPLSFV